jgi:sodium-dependent dicarboxylate transporter 2/3/5
VRPLRARVGLAAAIAVLLLMLGYGPPQGMAASEWRVAAVALFMATAWVTEALPIAATALVPLVAFPLLGVASIDKVVPHYANPILFLFLGGFVIAAAMEKWGLSRRIALFVVRVAGSRPDMQVAGFMAATGFISMWVSNTATTIMMLPIAVSVIAISERSGRGDPAFAPALLLAVAYAASIGGLGTLVGTPPNALLAAFLREQYGIQIGFAKWMLFGTPVAVLMMVCACVVLTRLVFAVGREPVPEAVASIDAELAALGPPGRGEVLTSAVFAAVALLWITQPLIAGWLPGARISDAGIAIAGALALFLIPVDLKRGLFLLDVEWVAKVPWDVIILFGGGLSLAAAIGDSGLSGRIGEALRVFAGWPTFALLLAVIAVVILLTEFASNTAVATVFLPIAGALAGAIGLAPTAIAVPAAVAASLAFMLPVATPPNAIVFGAGRLTVPQMALAGATLDLLAGLLVAVATYFLGGVLFGT